MLEEELHNKHQLEAALPRKHVPDKLEIPAQRRDNNPAAQFGSDKVLSNRMQKEGVMQGLFWHKLSKYWGVKL